MSEHDASFRCMGTTVRLLIGPPLDGALPSPAQAAVSAQSFLEDFDRRLSRFREDSELCALNSDPRAAVPASPLLRAAVGAALWAARETGGLVDPTLVGALERSGYRRSMAGARSPSLQAALACAPARRPARPRPGSPWTAIAVDDGEGLVRRPPGVRIDSGGSGKGLAADAVAVALRGYSRWVVDCGGDMRIGGPDATRWPYQVEVEHPATGAVVETIQVFGGGVATSGIGTRLWPTGDGYAHHLLDPATGAPAWTGLTGVTALAPTALEAETRAKAALLSGPEAARRVLRADGGILFHDDGISEPVGFGLRERAAA